MTREQKYTQQLKALGIYDPAFDPEIHTLAEMERDHQKARKAWKAAGSDLTSEIYPVLERQRRAILEHRDALGLTPRGLRRLRSSGFSKPDDDERDAQPTVLAMVASKYA